MRKMTAKSFQTNCLEILNEVSLTREPVLICKGKKIIAKLVPFGAPPKDFLGCLASIMKITGDIESPLWPTKL